MDFKRKKQGKQEQYRGFVLGAKTKQVHSEFRDVSIQQPADPLFLLGCDTKKNTSKAAIVPVAKVKEESQRFLTQKDPRKRSGGPSAACWIFYGVRWILSTRDCLNIGRCQIINNHRSASSNNNPFSILTGCKHHDSTPGHTKRSQRMS